MGIYVKFGDIKGEATHADYPQWIEASSFHWGVERSVTTEVGGADLRVPSHPSVGEITLTKEVDCASPDLLREVTTGKKGKTCQIDIVAGTRGVVCHFELENALISRVGLVCGGGTGESLQEQVAINFTAVVFKYVRRDADNIEQPSTLFGYDIATASRI